MINAEELGINSSNVNATEYNDVAAVARLDKEGNFGEELGLDSRWTTTSSVRLATAKATRSTSARTPR